MSKQYDYIIVGAGSAGCVLANKLSADPAVSVLLIESGPSDNHPLIRMPRGIVKFLAAGDPHVWSYDVAPGHGYPPEQWLKGRMLGGSSSINGMVYVRGAPADYDHWAALGCTGWSWAEMGPHFVALEDHELGKADWRGSGGPLKVSMHPAGEPICEALLEAAAQSGTSRVADMNHVEAVAQGGMSYQPTTTHRGQRFSAARAFLAPVRQRPNLEVLTDTDVIRIDFAGRRATGVTVRDGTGTRGMACRREIILAAGAVESPKLLQLSGVGPGELLQAHGIPVVCDSRGVGRNLREHRYLAVQFRVTDGSLNKRFAGLGLLKSVFDYALFSKGPLTHCAHEVGGFVKTRAGLERPDAQIGIGLYSMSKGTTVAIELDRHPGITIGGYFLRPESQGVLRIRSADARVAPDIDVNHLSAEIDRVSAVSLLRWIRRFAAQPALAPWIVVEQTPGSQVQSDEEIVEAFMRCGGTAYHVAGTCRMGADAEAVVDPQLRVRGIEGVRVADTSIMPTLVSGNTNAPAMAIGLRAAELIQRGA